MAKPPRPWIVAPHDPIAKLEDNLWSVDGDVPGMKFRRRMVIARRADGTLVFYNAVPLEDAAMAELAAWGKPGVIVIPNAFHRLDAHSFRARTGAKLVCAASARAKVEKVVAVDGTLEELPPDPTVSFKVIGGTNVGETAMIVRHGGGARATIAFADAVMNLPRSLGLLTTIMRTAGGPKCPPLFKLAFVKKKKDVAAGLAELAETPGLARLVPSHGDVLEGDAAGTLRTIVRRDL